ncbi:MAG: ABC transporter permease, partial [Gemmatimonadales bacterium]
LLKRPGFTLVVVSTLALGIGATTAIFSVVNGILLEPPAYHEPDRLARLYLSNVQGSGRGNLNPMDLVDLRAAGSVRGVAFRTRWEPTLTGLDRPVPVRVGLVSPDFFDVLGVRAAAGRWFRPEEGERGRDDALVLSHRRWLDLFGGDPDVVGRTVRLDGTPHTIIGVTPADFEDPFADAGLDGFVPWVVDPDNRGGHFMMAFARLGPEVRLPQAAAELNAIFAGIAERYTFKEGRTISLVPLTRAMGSEARTPLLILLGAVGLVLLIVCLNVASLMLTRSVDRAREVAVRTALGASRGRLLRQLLIESAVLAVAGGAAGLFAATWITGAVTAGAPVALPRIGQVGVDGGVIAFALVVTMVTAVVFGLWPAVRSSGVRARDALRTVARTGSGLARSGGRRGLVVAEVALSVCLLIAAGLMVRTVVKLLDVDTGFRDPERVLTFAVTTPSSRYPSGAEVRQFYDRLTAHLAAQPGVEAVGAVNMLPLAGSYSCNSFALDDRPDPYLECAEERIVQDEYFAAMRIPTLRGRAFGPGDDAAGAPVAVISETMARRFWPGGDPIGTRFKWGARDNDGPWATIVGIVADVKHYGLEREAAPEVYLNQAQLDFAYRSWTLTVRTAAAPASALAPAVRAGVRALDPDMAVQELLSMDTLVASAAAPWRFTTQLLVGFAAVAALLAALGLYGVLAFSVAQRRREIGIRMAVGARSGDVLRDVVGQGALLIAVGVGIGVAGALAATRVMRGLLFEVSATDPVVFALAPLLLGGVGLLAAWLPARRAARTDPMEALRHE